jgi:dipeptidyl aminopeptidase/acylaminoacyl peptidase
VKYYTWDRAAQKATFLFSARPLLEKYTLAPMRPVEIRTRDGLSLPSYLTLPVGVEGKNLPMVLYVHGGPWARDEWGYEPYAQWYANRGYAVLQVNYRGSDGFGKKFRNAAMKEFSGKMHDDLVDAVQWAIAQGIADPKRIAITGGSYGGYATHVGVTFTPDLFACGVDIVGPSNLVSLVESFPPYWGPILSNTWYPFVGNPKDAKDRADMEARSPLTRADRIRVPLLIGQGGNDPRVTAKESEQIVAAIAKNGGNVTYVLYPDEGHGFVRPENRIDFNARSEVFLAACLAGRSEPMQGDKVTGSTASVKVVGK